MGQYYVDDLLESNKTIYEFLGCIWHACTECFANNRSITCNPYNGFSMDYMYKCLEERLLKL